MPVDTNPRRRRQSSTQKIISSTGGNKTYLKSIKRKGNKIMEQHPSMSWIVTNAIFYVLSGVTQPILMAYASHAGLANAKCQLYMLFYYIGPALAGFSLRCSPRKQQSQSESSMQQLLSQDDQKKRYNAQDDNSSDSLLQNPNNIDEEEEYWPSSRKLLIKASGIALFDIFAQSMVYTGNNLAGPTVFAIIYSSVTIWAALFSRVLLSRSLVKLQWAGVCLVVLGLALTALDSKTVGKNVFLGACLIVVGSSFHGLTYVMCEKIMMPSSTESVNGNDTTKEREHLSVRANCAVQGIVAMLAFLLWQIFYTLPRLEPLILAPMRETGTTALQALFILGTITVSNFVHSLTFFVTLKYFPGGATSAGVLKGLQAVLVFAAGAYFLCERWGGREMCWSNSKFASLVIVVSGIMMYGAFTEKKDIIRATTLIDEEVDIL